MAGDVLRMGRIRRRAKRTRKLPLRSCAVTATWREGGRARLLVVREQRDGRMVVGRFDIDLWCMGLVRAEVMADVSVAALGQLRAETFDGAPPVACTPELAASIVLGGIDYAARLGFEPHAAWNIAQHVLPPKPRRDEAIEFGRDGLPCYVAGAGDDELILAQLESRLGEGAFSVLLR
jgi:hypothetical protein